MSTKPDDLDAFLAEKSTDPAFTLHWEALQATDRPATTDQQPLGAAPHRRRDAQGGPPMSKRTAVTHLPPSPPSEPTGGQSCDAGCCDLPAVGWRWYVADRRWLPVCYDAIANAPAHLRRYDHEYESTR